MMCLHFTYVTLTCTWELLKCSFDLSLAACLENKMSMNIFTLTEMSTSLFFPILRVLCLFLQLCLSFALRRPIFSCDQGFTLRCTMSIQHNWTLVERWRLWMIFWWSAMKRSGQQCQWEARLWSNPLSILCPYGSTVRQSSRRLESKVWWSRRRRTRRGGCRDRLQHGEGADGSAEGDVYEADDGRRCDCFYQEWQMGGEPAARCFQQRILTFVGALCTNSHPLSSVCHESEVDWE